MPNLPAVGILSGHVGGLECFGVVTHRMSNVGHTVFAITPGLCVPPFQLCQHLAGLALHWSDREIARRCNVSDPFVADMRQKLTANVSSDGTARTYITKHGTPAVMQTANIGGNGKVKAATGRGPSCYVLLRPV